MKIFGWKPPGVRIRGRRCHAAGWHPCSAIEPDTAIAIDLPLSALGGAVQVLATGVGDLGGPASVAESISGASILPPAPVHLRIERGADGEALLRWMRRSRAGWRWNDHVDAPLVEEREEYRVTIAPVEGASRTTIVDVPEIALLAGELATSTHVTVAQRGSWGESLPAAIDS